MNIADQLRAAHPSQPVAAPALPGHLALLFGTVRPPIRPAGAPVRAHRIGANPAKLPTLPRSTNAHPAVARAHEQREQILILLTERGEAMRRQDIAAATGIAEVIVGERLTELKKLGVVRFERGNHSALWEAIEAEEEGQ